MDIWENLSTEDQLHSIIDKSNEKVQVIFKHSTRCSISHMAKDRVEQNWDLDPDKVDIYYLDLLNYRSISDQIAQELNVQHESPQMIVLKNGKVVYHQSHGMIHPKDISPFLN